MASSYEKIIKKIMDHFAEGLAPLRTIVQNQEIIIVQNKKIIELLDALNAKLAASQQVPPAE
ncbi:MAG: hypothetical protein N2491_11645 [Negativicutes bacterium]|nr:hypothetical protein [Negativicutes bacterium]